MENLTDEQKRFIVKSLFTIDIMGYDVNLTELIADVEAAKKKFTRDDFCFTWATVEGLIDSLVAIDVYYRDVFDLW